MLKRLGLIAGLLNIFMLNAYAHTINLPEASVFAVKVDRLHDFLFWLSVIALGGTTMALIWFVVKYHRSNKGRTTAFILGNHTLEFTWTVIPLIVLLMIFAWGYRDYTFFRQQSPNAVEINVIGRQWLWNFEYPNGRKTMNELYLPKGKSVRLIMTSEDVIHSFFLPYSRVKQDVVPGMYTYLDFEPTLVGEQPIYCTMYCGTGHSDMLAKAYVLEPKDYEKWLETGKAPGIVKAKQASATPGGKPVSPATKGKAVAESKGCFACHSVDGTRKVGPSWKGIWGKDEELEGGSTAKVDENYIRDSIMNPTAKIVKGYPPSMPPFKGLLNDEEVNDLIAYIKSLK